MDRLAELAAELNAVLDRLRQEAVARDARDLQAPLAWLDEANGWLKYELTRIYGADPRDPVPFTYIPVGMRR